MGAPTGTYGILSNFYRSFSNLTQILPTLPGNQVLILAQGQIWHVVTKCQALADRLRSVFTKLHPVFFYSSNNVPSPYTTSGPSRVAHASIQFTEQPKSGRRRRVYIRTLQDLYVIFAALRKCPVGATMVLKHPI